MERYKDIVKILLLSILSGIFTMETNAQGGCQAFFNIQSNGANVIFNNASTGSFTTAAWNFGDGSSSSSLSANHTYNAPGSYYVCLTISNPNLSCVDTYCDTVVIGNTLTCHANFNFLVGISTSGNNYVVSFSNTSTGMYSSVAWDFGDNHFSVQRNPTHSYFAPGTYTVCLTITDSSGNCHDVVCKNITLTGSNTGCVDTSRINPTAGCFTLYDPVCGCNGITYGNACEAEHWGGVTNWTQGPCPNTSPCQARFNYSVIVGIAGYTVTFNNTSIGNYDFSLWDFGNGDTSKQRNPSYTYFAASLPAVVKVCLSISDSLNQCHDTYCEVLNFNPTPCVDPSIINQNTVCPLVFDPVCGCNGITYNNACEARYRHGVTSWTPGACNVSPGCHAEFTFTPNGNTVNFQNNSLGNYTFSGWNFGDGTAATFSKNATHTYLAPGRYTVCLMITDSSQTCRDTICHPVTIAGHNFPCTDTALIRPASCPQVYEPVCGCDGITYSNACVASNYGGLTNWVQGPCAVVINSPCKALFNFSINPTPIGYEVQFNNSSSGNITNVDWDFGDGTNSHQQNATHTYLIPGRYVVCLTVSNNLQNCSDTYCINIYVNAGNNCIASSSIDTSVQCPGVINPVCGCDGKTYVNSCDAFYKHGVSYWTPGACNSGGCQANFSYVRDSASGGIRFTNTSLGPHTQVYWDFGDGSNSVQSNPLHIYSNASAAVYNVCLSIYDSQNSCYDTYCRNISVSQVINTNCVAHFSWIADTADLSVEFINQSTGPVNSFLWDFGDGVADSSENPVHFYQNKDPRNVCLKAEGSSQGCVNMFCDSVRFDVSTAVPEFTSSELMLKVFPNPFNESTNIIFELSAPMIVKAEIFDMIGKRIEVLANGSMSSGLHRLTWQSEKAGSGIYLLSLSIEGNRFTRRLVVTKDSKR